MTYYNVVTTNYRAYTTTTPRVGAPWGRRVASMYEQTEKPVLQDGGLKKTVSFVDVAGVERIDRLERKEPVLIKNKL